MFKELEKNLYAGIVARLKERRGCVQYCMDVRCEPERLKISWLPTRQAEQKRITPVLRTVHYSR
jgi:hypothetical protein